MKANRSAGKRVERREKAPIHLEARAMSVVGVTLISESTPSFGTPLFSNNNDSNLYLQSFTQPEKIESFVRIGGIRPRKIVRHALNAPVSIGEEAIIAFRDREAAIRVMRYSDMRSYLYTTIEQYRSVPFTFYSIAKFIGDAELFGAAIKMPVIWRAIESGQIAGEDDAGPVVTEVRTYWTDQRVEKLKALWSEGLSASQIAAELGGITRNAVIGKVHKLRLSGRAKASPPGVERTTKPVSSPVDLSTLEYSELKATRNPQERRLSLLELNENTCRWPIGDPGSSDFFFCGGDTVDGLPYCAYHSRVVDATLAPKDRGHRNNPKRR